MCFILRCAYNLPVYIEKFTGKLRAEVPWINIIIMHCHILSSLLLSVQLWVILQSAVRARASQCTAANIAYFRGWILSCDNSEAVPPGCFLIGIPSLADVRLWTVRLRFIWRCIIRKFYDVITRTPRKLCFFTLASLRVRLHDYHITILPYHITIVSLRQVREILAKIPFRSIMQIKKNYSVILQLP